MNCASAVLRNLLMFYFTKLPQTDGSLSTDPTYPWEGFSKTGWQKSKNIWIIFFWILVLEPFQPSTIVKFIVKEINNRKVSGSKCKLAQNLKRASHEAACTIILHIKIDYLSYGNTVKGEHCTIIYQTCQMRVTGVWLRTWYRCFSILAMSVYCLVGHTLSVPYWRFCKFTLSTRITYLLFAFPIPFFDRRFYMHRED